MERVLIPTEDLEILPGVVEGYQKLGFEPVAGTRNFFLRAAAFDLIHFFWPEELTAWTAPSPAKLRQIEETLDWWMARSRTLISVNNLYPHGHEGNPAYKQLYELFYSRCPTILHHSETSRKLVNAEFPVSRTKRNVVATMFNYDRYLPPKLDRDRARESFGFGRQDFVVLVFGAIRKFDEIRLVRRAFAAAKAPHKRLLMAGRFTGTHNCPPSLGQRAQWKLWLKRIRAVCANTFIPDHEVHRYFEAADVVLIPRITDLSSGVVGLGATFGRLLIAPNHGSFPDYLAGTRNLFFDPQRPADLARAITEASQVDRDAAGRLNRQVGDGWTWEAILRSALVDSPCLDSVLAG